MLSVIIPYRSDHAERERNFMWCEERYHEAFPNAEFIVCGDGSESGPFNKAKAINAGVAMSHGDLIMLADADCAIDFGWAKLAQAWAHNTGGWALTVVCYYLTKTQTERLVVQDPCKPIDLPETCDYIGFSSVGGHLLLTRDAFDRVNGADERFTDWGPEDAAFAMALTKLVGEPERIGGVLVHLWHPAPPTTRPWSPGAGELMQRYSAAGTADAMKRVVKGNR